MASPEEVIEAVTETSAADTLGRRRFSRDIHSLSPDELDGLMSSSGRRTQSTAVIPDQVTMMMMMMM